MPRKGGIEYEGAYYHMMARGDRRKVTFPGEKDWALFLDTLGQVCEKTGWRVHAWMRGMQWFQNTYTRRRSQRHGLCGQSLDRAARR